MAYRLEDLGAHEFEHLVQALLLRVYGPTVQVFGTGPDSGRDAVFEGRAVPLEGGDQHAEPWDGYHVFQVKFREQLQSTAANKTWLLTQIRRELDKWADPKKGRKGPKPEYIVFVTNVGLGGAVDGGLDQATQVIRSKADSHEWPLKDCAVWDRAKVERLLDGYADVRQKFNALISLGDVLASANLGRMTGLGARIEDIRPVLEEDARTELITRGQINLGEGGQVANQKLDLAHVAVDLPARYPDNPDPLAETFPAIAHIVAAGERVLRPSVLGDGDPHPHFLVMGGPGQGKTTLGRLLAQLYRATMLADREGLSAPARAAAADTLGRAAEIGVPRPRARRWPVRVDLAEYADLAAGGGLPLVRYVADRISSSTGETFHIRDMRAWLKAWPWLLVLDGYDEVAAKPAREAVAAAVSQLLEQAHTEDADLLVVATTRPHGYSDELPAAFRKLELVALSADQAVDYASRLTELRMGDDADKPAVLQRVTDAAANELTRRLMRTPLQVMIMSLLLERRSKPPQDRAALFADYYDVIYDREVQKKNYLATVLAERRPDVDAIHHATGLRLQIASESAGDAEALLSAQDFEGIIRTRLTDQGHEGGALENLTGDLLRAARDRLVLVTAKGRDQVGFELRSIQEFMAARALVEGPDEQVVERLRVIAPAAHWRNTWLLAVGAVYRSRPHLFDPVLHMMRELDASDTFSLIVETAPRLAIDILDDGMASKSPKHLRLLVDLALQLLNGPNLGAGRLGDVLAEIGDDDDVVRARVVAAVQRAWDGAPSAHEAAALVLERLTGSDQQGALPARARQMRAAKPSGPRTVGPGAPGTKVRLSEALPEYARSWTRTTVEGRFVEEMRHVKTVLGPSGEFVIPGGITPRQAATDVLSDDTALTLVAEAIDAIEPYNWSGRTAIVAFLWRARERIPVAHHLAV